MFSSAPCSISFPPRLGLRWGSVDLERGIVRVVERLYRRLKPADARPEGFVFDRQGKSLDDWELLRNVFRPAADRLGIGFPGFGWHTFRCMHLTLIQEEGAATFEAMVQAGHSRPSMTGEYTIIGMERREAAVRRLQRRLLLREEQAEKGASGFICGTVAG